MLVYSRTFYFIFSFQKFISAYCLTALVDSVSSFQELPVSIDQVLIVKDVLSFSLGFCSNVAETI